MADYFVIEKGPCPDCEGRGRRRRRREEPGDWAIGETFCLDCDGMGVRRLEVPLAEALAALGCKVTP